MPFISSVHLHHFRCYREAHVSNLAQGLIVLHGPNGAGKTNVLEALSLLTPGRGLRNAAPPDMQCLFEGKPWAVAAKITDSHGSAMVGTGLDAQSGKRVIRINGEAVKSQGSLSDYLSCVWLTPQMDRLFVESASHRRKFLDRLVFAFDPGHTGRVNRYENAMAQRSRVLKEAAQKNMTPDAAWLAGLESQMAETGVSIAAARLDFTQRLQMSLNAADAKIFPRALLGAIGAIETLLQSSPALAVEEIFSSQLRASRARDAVSGGAATGPHKSDLTALYAGKNMPAAQCSTGEQKALLIGIVLAHAALIQGARGAPPVLLLDEIAAHLDEDRRRALYDILGALGGQVWLTGTDESLFSAIQSSAQFFEVRDARIFQNGRQKQSYAV